MSTCLATPVALMIFNRPELTARTFEAIAQAKPEKLFVVADGPRSPEESERCRQARAIIERVDWPCEVLTNFADTNLGCRRRISSGLDWVFSEVEEAIILEDDCVAALSFFSFCQELLEKYRHDERVMHIGGCNFQDEDQTPYSYYFSRYLHVWGWATWRRAWELFDVNMSSWPETRTSIADLFDDDVERDYFVGAFELGFQGDDQIWDYMWSYACLAQSGLSVVPHVNLVSNIGWGVDATHTNQEIPGLANRPAGNIGPLRHPPSVLVNRRADKYAFEHVFGGANLRNQQATGNSWVGSLKSKVSQLIRPGRLDRR